ncbi:unnamed protein product [Ectocarpus sp. CCAP 1310/34]|nr:unnamed protein product [Ectocarpus sp. CCAP 1310/34]
MRAVLPSPSLAPTSAPARISAVMASTWPASAARSRAFGWSSGTPATRRATSAPAARRASSAANRSGEPAARCSGDLPRPFTLFTSAPCLARAATAEAELATVAAWSGLEPRMSAASRLEPLLTNRSIEAIWSDSPARWSAVISFGGSAVFTSAPCWISARITPT